MRKKEILKSLQGIKLCLMAHPDNEENSEFEIRINQIEEIEESIPKYADEFACAFADYLVKNYQPRFPNKGEWVKTIDSNKFKTVYTTTELLEIFNKEQDGL